MTSVSRPLRFGLVGTGYWARGTHAPALAATDGIEFAAVWGRDRQATADLAAACHATPHHEEAAFLADVGPHLVSLLWASLGPVTSVLADAGPADVTHLILHHQGGASSAVTVTLSAAEKTEHPETYLWGASGRSVAPIGAPHPVTQMRTALTELAANARSGRTGHPCDVRFGRDVGRVLAGAQRQIDARAR